jgi:RND family efflux transporter MFP subunit
MICARRTGRPSALWLAAGLIVFPGRGATADEPPALTVEALYPGATASVVEQTIATPIEQYVSGVEHLRQLRSRSGRDGSYTLDVFFAAGTDLNLAQILVQNRVNVALPNLPAETRKLGVTVKKRSPGLVMIIALLSPDARFDSRYLSAYATINVKDDLARLPGVAEVAVLGGQQLAARIRLDPEKLAARNLTAAEVTRALEQQSVETTAGSSGAFHLTPSARGGLTQPDQLETIVIKADADGHVVRLRDVASSLEIGAGQTGFASLDGKPVAMLGIDPLSHAPRQDVCAAVHARLKELRPRFPEGVEAFAGFDFARPAAAESPAYLLFDVNPPEGASAERTGKRLSHCERLLLQTPGVRHVLALADQPFDRRRAQPCVVACLEPVNGAPADRERLVREIRTRFTTDLPEAFIRIRDLSGAAQSPRFGYPIEFALAGPDRSRVQELSSQLLERLSQDQRVTDLWSGPRPTPTMSADIDRAKAATLGLSVSDISASLQTVLGSTHAGNINGFGRTWPVWVQVDSPVPPDADAWNRLMVRGDKGQMVPLGAVATLRRENQPVYLERINLFPAVSITASPAGNLSLAEARFVCEHLAADVLPKQRPAEYSLVWWSAMPAAQPPATPEPPAATVVPPSVSVIHPIQREVAEYEDFTGRLESALKVDLRPRVTGYLNRVLFGPGPVKKGELLFEVDPRPRQAALDRAEAEYRLRESQLNFATIAVKRDRGRRAQNLIAQDDVDRAESARADAEAALNVAKVARETARLELEFTRIVAPIDGRISQPLVHPGNVVRADETLLATLVSVEPMYVFFDIDERTVLRLRRQERQGKAPQDGNQQKPIMIGLTDEPGFPRRGAFTLAGARIDPGTGMIRCRAVLPNPDGFLVPGLFARLRLAVGPPAPAILVPEQAIATDQEQPFVLVVTGANLVARRVVQLGPALEGLRVVLRGIASDDWVVIDGPRGLAPGTEVKPQQRAP